MREKLDLKSLARIKRPPRQGSLITSLFFLVIPSRWIKRGFFFMLIYFTSLTASARWMVKDIPDPPEVPTTEEVDALEEKARAGDWELKSHFAAAYLYELPEFKALNYKGCAELTYGYLCRAMAARSEAAFRFLKEVMDVEIIETPVAKPGTSPVQYFRYGKYEPMSRVTQKVLQESYGFYQYDKAAPDFLPESVACQATLHYLEKSADTVLKTDQICSHAAERLLYMTSSGKCLPKGDTRFDKYKKRIDNCPMP